MVASRLLVVRVTAVAFIAIASSGVWTVASAQSSANVGVIINDNSPASQQIGDYYVRKRGIPSSNVFRLRTSTEEAIDRTTYSATIEAPLMTAITRSRLQDRLLYLVLTKGVPLRIAGDSGDASTAASVDSELTLLYQRMTGRKVPLAGRLDNPYFLGARALSEARRFSHRDSAIYLVTRLDAFTTQEAMALVDKAIAPNRQGRIVLDQQARQGERSGEDRLQAAANRLSAQGQSERVLLDTTAKAIRNVTPVLGYYSWGSNDPNNRTRRFNLGFVPGSIAAMYVNGARTFAEPPKDWIPGSDAAEPFAGSTQSLLGDLIREGATGVAGHVAEPTPQSAIRPDVLFPAYLSGLNLAESFYLATPHLSGDTVVIGDPLGAPFARALLPKSESEPSIDSLTELPEFFSKWRLAFVTASMKGVPERALLLGLRAESRMARSDLDGAREALEESTAIAPGLAGAHLQLAILHDGAGRYDAAIERYKQVIQLQPRNVIALNNLAYDLAVRKGDPERALAFAKQAGAVEPRNPVVLDTLAWIEHLRGNNDIAAKLMAIVVQRLPNRSDLRMHAAAIYAATGNALRAKDELAEALKLNPALEGSDDVKRVQAQLRELGR